MGARKVTKGWWGVSSAKTTAVVAAGCTWRPASSSQGNEKHVYLCLTSGLAVHAHLKRTPGTLRTEAVKNIRWPCQRSRCRRSAPFPSVRQPVGPGLHVSELGGKLREQVLQPLPGQLIRQDFLRKSRSRAAHAAAWNHLPEPSAARDRRHAGEIHRRTARSVVARYCTLNETCVDGILTLSLPLLSSCPSRDSC